MNIDHNKLEYISGPNVAIVLEGKINNIKKKILLFGEHHLKNDQNECIDPDSVPIKNYLHDLFKKTDKDIDFFLENNNNQYYQNKFYTTQYLNQLRNYFNDNQNRFKNVKFHFSDIRNEYIWNIKNNFIVNFQTISNIISNRNINIDEIIMFKQKINYCEEIIDIILSLLKNDKVNINLIRDIDNNFKKDFIKNIYKIINKYDNNIIRNKIRSIIKLSTFGLVEDLNKMRKMLTTIENKLEEKKIYRYSDFYSYYEVDKFIYHFGTLYYKITYKLLSFFSLLTDIYTVRRILDKDYIKNVITYNGALHIKNMINIFVNYFDFKIITKFDSNYKIPIDNQYFKKYYTKYNDDGRDYNINFIEQCVNISKFKKPII